MGCYRIRYRRHIYVPFRNPMPTVPSPVGGESLRSLYSALLHCALLR